LLERRDDSLFEPFCQALEESENRAVVKLHFEKYRAAGSKTAVVKRPVNADSTTASHGTVANGK